MAVDESKIHQMIPQPTQCSHFDIDSKEIVSPFDFTMDKQRFIDIYDLLQDQESLQKLLDGIN